MVSQQISASCLDSPQSTIWSCYSSSTTIVALLIKLALESASCMVPRALAVWIVKHNRLFTSNGAAGHQGVVLQFASMLRQIHHHNVAHSTISDTKNAAASFWSQWTAGWGEVGGHDIKMMKFVPFVLGGEVHSFLLLWHNAAHNGFVVRPVRSDRVAHSRWWGCHLTKLQTDNKVLRLV